MNALFRRQEFRLYQTIQFAFTRNMKAEFEEERDCTVKTTCGVSVDGT